MLIIYDIIILFYYIGCQFTAAGSGDKSVSDVAIQCNLIDFPKHSTPNASDEDLEVGDMDEHRQVQLDDTFQTTTDTYITEEELEDSSSDEVSDDENIYLNG